MFKKTLFIVISFLVVTVTAYGATNLWEWYGGELPSCEDRAGLYSSYFSDEYKCTEEQNELLLAALKNIAVFGSGGVVFDTGSVIPVSLAKGGTGSTGFTAGSVIFSNGSILTEDNSNLFWDDTNNRLGIGTSSPSTLFSIKSSSGTTTIALSNETGSTANISRGTWNIKIIKK